MVQLSLTVTQVKIDAALANKSNTVVSFTLKQSQDVLAILNISA